jgi:hypothetical protein
MGTYGNVPVPSGMPPHTVRHYDITPWNDETGLLPFFLEPDQRALYKVGYRHAAGCLLSKHCFHCGKMACTANPFTMTRICKACDRNNEASFAICKAKAKEAFLLGEKYLRDLVSVSHPVGMITGGNNIRTSVMDLMLDVKNASFNKFGGADGLAQEISIRTEKAMTKYNKSQSTAKPQKKRPKVRLHVPTRYRDRYVLCYAHSNAVILCC